MDQNRCSKSQREGHVRQDRFCRLDPCKSRRGKLFVRHCLNKFGCQHNRYQYRSENGSIVCSLSMQDQICVTIHREYIWQVFSRGKHASFDPPEKTLPIPMCFGSPDTPLRHSPAIRRPTKPTLQSAKETGVYRCLGILIRHALLNLCRQYALEGLIVFALIVALGCHDSLSCVSVEVSGSLLKRLQR